MIKNYIQSSYQNVAALLENEPVAKNCEELVERLVECLKNGNTVFLAGNGGSAADSQHIAGELVSRFNFDRPGLSAIALTTDTSILTAVGNDYGYENIFSRQIRAIAKPNDFLFAYSTSGSSRNILNLLKAANELNVNSVLFTGENNGVCVKYADWVLAVPSKSTPKIQEGHLILGHAICESVEQKIFGSI